MRYVTRFLMFWYDFLVGDAWEVAAGVVLALVLAALIALYQPALSVALGPALALVFMALLGGSIWLQLQRR